MVSIFSFLFSQQRQRQLWSGLTTSFDICYFWNYACLVLFFLIDTKSALKSVSPSFYMSYSGLIAMGQEIDGDELVPAESRPEHPLANCRLDPH